jgi:hypothetical protein
LEQRTHLAIRFPGNRELPPPRPSPWFSLARFALARIALVIVLALLTLQLLAVAQQRVPEDQVKAAYLFNFAKVGEWPDHALQDGPSPFGIGVSGADDDFLDAL